jgi:hypothetical protein
MLPAGLRSVPALHRFLHDLPLFFRSSIYAWSSAPAAFYRGGPRFYLGRPSSFRAEDYNYNLRLNRLRDDHDEKLRAKTCDNAPDADANSSNIVK